MLVDLYVLICVMLLYLLSYRRQIRFRQALNNLLKSYLLLFHPSKVGSLYLLPRYWYLLVYSFYVLIFKGQTNQQLIWNNLLRGLRRSLDVFYHLLSDRTNPFVLIDLDQCHYILHYNLIQSFFRLL